MKELHELKEMLCDELKEYGKKGELSAGSLSTIDTLAHAVKNLDKIIEVNEGDYSNRTWMNDRDSYRGSYARRRDGYSRTDIKGRLHELLDEVSDDRTRDEIRRLIEKM